MQIEKEIMQTKSVMGGQLNVTLWKPENPRALVQISHGMREHMGRYDEIGRYLALRGYLVFGNDHVGHGNSAASPDDFGFFGDAGGVDALVGDLRGLNARIAELYPDLPRFLLGHSMGSFLARLYIVRHRDLAGCVICGTGNRPDAALGVRLANFEIKRKGSRYRSEWLEGFAFGGYNARFADEKNDYSWLTRDPAIREAFASDPMCDYRFTLAGLRDLFDMLARVSRASWAREVPKDLPIFLIAGADDPVGDYGKAVPRLEARLRAAGLRDLTCVIYPECRHELFNELNRSDIYADLASWLDERCAK